MAWSTELLGWMCGKEVANTWQLTAGWKGQPQ